MTPFLDANLDLHEVHSLVNHPALSGALAVKRFKSEDEVARFLSASIDVAICVVRDEHRCPIGFFAARWLNPYCVKLSGAFFPECRGKVALEASKQMINFLFGASVVKIVGEVAATNHASLQLAGALGFQREGVNRASIFVDGTLVDQVHIGLTRGEWKYGLNLRQ